MYDFIDVNSASGGVMLPSEALKINGEYIENQIPGYRTLNVKGREALSPDVSTYETGIRDGSKIQSKRFPERIITVTYQIAAESNEAFRDAYNKLGSILNVEEAELIFADEPDKFFIGTPCTISEVEPGRNAVVGEFEILCADPFKYSVIEYEAKPSLDASSVLINYKGTYKAYPTLEADFYNESEVGSDGETAGTLTGSGDCGFVAFFTEDKKIIQLGDPDEADTTGNYAKSQTLVNQTFLSDTAWGTTAKSLWSVNNGVVPQSDVSQTGSVAMSAASYTTASAPANTSGTLLNASSTASAPKINYSVIYGAWGRTETSVNLTIAITTSLGSDGSYFGNGYGLVGYVYVGGSWHSITLKSTSDYWQGSTGHTVNLYITINGLSSTTTALTGIKFKVERSDSYGNAGKLGETACNDIAVSKYEVSVPESYYLSASSYGTSNGKWHGPSISRSIPADAAGEVGAENFTLTYKQKMCIGNSSTSTGQIGGFHVYLSASDGSVVAGVRIVKTQAGKSASLMLYVNGTKVHQVGIDLSYYNSYFGVGGSCSSTIRKTGNKVVFNIAGYRKTFTDDSISSKKSTKITFMFEQLGNYPVISYNGLSYAKFTKNKCATYKDIPNKFGANDVVTADCKNAEIRLNGIVSPELGALGNDWEEFVLTPGLNQIGVAFSDWVASGYEPTFKVRYREVFL